MGLIDLDGLDGTFHEVEAKVRAELALPSVIVEEPPPDVREEPPTVVRGAVYDGPTQALALEDGPPPLASDEPTVLRPPPALQPGRPPSGAASALLIGAAIGAAVVAGVVLLRPAPLRRPVGSGGVISVQTDAPAPTRAPAPLVTREPEPEPPVPDPVALPVRFALGQRAFVARDFAELDESVEDFVVRCRGRVIVTGHTCRIGGERYNRRLGLERARAVRDLLVLRGVDPGRVQIASAGGTRPVASNKTAGGRQRNRRVTLACEPPKTEGER